MINNFNIRLLAGGKSKCDQSWNMDVHGKDRCYKLYWITEGEAFLNINGTNQKLTANNIYLISGQHIERQFCENEFKVYWLHYVPQSPLLLSMLSKSDPFLSWSIEKYSWIKPFLQDLPTLFQKFKEERKLMENLKAGSSSSALCQLQAVILFFVGELLKSVNEKEVEEEFQATVRFKKALEYMDRHLVENPSLEEIADKCHMAPNYFHRAFKKNFSQTPFEYIQNQRINRAKELLSFTAFTIKEIATEIGYKNEFHFSKAFKKVTGLSPSSYRKG